MGMYTELYISVEVNAPEDSLVANVLERLFNMREDRTAATPDHPFFKTPRWGCIGRHSSFYHTPMSTSKVSRCHPSNRDVLYVTSRSDLKNYDNEINLFLDWLSRHLHSPCEGDYLGHVRYEECELPDLLLWEGGRITRVQVKRVDEE